MEALDGLVTIRRKLYSSPHGMPLHWRQDQVGDLRAAVVAYLEVIGPVGEVVYYDPDAFIRVRDYAHYFLQAPCWVIRPGERQLRLHAIQRCNDPGALALILASASDMGVNIL